MPTATVRRGVVASDDRKRTPPNCELHGHGLQQRFNYDFGHPRREDAPMV
jgi:hypothetical protein